MHQSMRVAPLVAGLMLAGTSAASVDLTLVRSGVGVTGAPKQLSRDLDADGDGRRELVVAGRWHVSLVEEDANPRGYREVGRADAPAWAQFESVLLVDVPGAAPALLVRWSDRLELRDPATLRLKATLAGQFGLPLLGDVDGDGIVEIVVSSASIELLDTSTLTSRGSVWLPVDPLALADITGDARAELVSNDGRAFTVTRNGNELSATLTWDAGIAGTWIPYAFDFDGHQAVVLHNAFGFSAQLATFRPTQSLRTLVPSDGPSFVPRFADANGDGRVDIVVATTSNVRALDIASGATLWTRDTSYQQPYIGSVYSPAVTDLDGDGTIEVAWADASYDSGVVAISAPLAGAPRWHADAMQSRVADWTTARRADGTASIAYLTYGTHTAPSLGTLGFLDAVSFADAGGSALAWLPGYTGIGKTIRQSAVASLPSPGQPDALVVVGAEYPLFGGEPVARSLWTFDGSGTLLSTRAFAGSTDPQRIVAAQVLDRPERQLVVAGWLPSAGSQKAACVEVIDYATGGVLWKSVPLPSYSGAPLTKIEVADLDADGRLDVVVAYGENATVLTPAAGTGMVANHAAWTFSLLDRGAGRQVRLATVRNTDVAFYDGIGTTPDKTLVLPEASPAIALFTQAPDDALMFATSGYGGITVRRYADGAVMATNAAGAGAGFTSLAAIDTDGDRRTEIVAADPGFVVWRLDNDYVFRNGFD